jgi:signal transduction histidine kinase
LTGLRIPSVGRSIRFRLLMPVACVCVVAVVLSALAPRWLASRLIGQRLHERAESVALTVGYAAESGIEREGLTRLVTAMGADRDVAHIVAVAGDPARVVAGTRRAWTGMDPSDLPQGLVSAAAADSLAARRDASGASRDRDQVFSVVPIGAGAELSRLSGGAVLVVMDSSAINAEVALWSRRIAGVLIGAALLVVAAGLLIIDAAVLRPLDGVVAAIRANDAAPAPATEELGLVAAAYNMNRASAIASGAAMKRALVKIEEASHAKSAFLANMSHEIRTPMTAILGYLEVLGERMVSDPAEASEMMRAVRSNGDLLMAIINDILDVSRIEAQQLTVERIETDPSRAVLDTAALMGPIAAERGVGLRVEQATPIPERIVSDPTRLRQIVNNLVSNAVKFTEEGRVTIRLACDPGRERLSIAVADTGCGMTPEQREAIGRFRPFTQADASVARRHGGSGLGLCIANGLAERLGGGIRIESEAGRGSTFTVAIGTGPLDGVPMRAGTAVERPPAPDAPAGPVKAGACLRGARIEVVDDGPDNRRLLRFLLERAGAGVVLHENGQRALDALDPGDPPDLVLMDMQMPEVDGYAATRELRARGFVCPIVAVTAHAMAGDREGCLEAGCDDYLSKPIDRAGLYETCERWIGVGRSRARGSAA